MLTVGFQSLYKYNTYDKQAQRVVDAVRRRCMKVENRVRLLVCKTAVRETDQAIQYRC